MGRLEDAYKNKVVLVTGHTGFKGSWLSIWLKQLGATVVGYGLDPYTERDNFVVTHLSNRMIDIRGDIRDIHNLEQIFKIYRPEIVFHLAAQPLVRESYEMPLYTYETNVVGTIHVLECIRHTPSVKVGIMITTDKCYQNKEQIWGYKENDSLGGYDPYSSSKAAAELAIQSWRASFFNPKTYEVHGKAVASARAGNVIGGGDFAKDRIIPDCVRALEDGTPIMLRNPSATRPWQHVLEPLSGYLLLGSKLLEDPITYSESWNFGPNLDSVVSVREVAKLMTKYYGTGHIAELTETAVRHEAQLLNLDISKAVLKLGWKPTWGINKAIAYTAGWYKNDRQQDPYELCVSQIEAFEKDSKEGMGL